MLIDYKITVDEKKAKHLLAFLKDLDFVEIEKEKPKKKKTAKSSLKKKPVDKDFPYFGMCPDWDIDAKTLREQSNHRLKAKW